MDMEKNNYKTSYKKHERNGENDIFIPQPNREMNTQDSRCSWDSTLKKRKSQAFSRQWKEKHLRVLQPHCNYKMCVVTTQQYPT